MELKSSHDVDGEITCDPRALRQIASIIHSLSQGDLASPVVLNGDENLALIARELELLREHLLHTARERQAIANLTEQILAGDSLNEVLNHIYDSFHSLIPYDRIGFALVEEDGRVVRSHWARSDLATQLLGNGYCAPLRGSTLSTLLETGEIRILNDLEEYFRYKPESESTRLILAEGIHSSLTCPIVANGKPVGFLFFSSTRKNAYRDMHVSTFQRLARRVSLVLEKSRLHEQLIFANQQKNRFLGIVAHDLRSPLSVIMGFLGLIFHNKLGSTTNSQQDALRRMDHNCRSMLRMIDGLLDLSAIESGNLELELTQIDPAEFLRDWHEGMQMLAQAKSISLVLQAPDELPLLVCDQQRIEQALTNLATNAFKFSPANSQVMIRASINDNELQISVQDQGPGIPAAEVGLLFKEYSRSSVRPSAGEKSTGLGLAIAKKMIEAHGGRLWVQSNLGGGSTFTFSIPLSKD